MVFKIQNPFYHQGGDVLFEPSDSLPSQIRSTPVVGEGRELYVRMENFGDEEQMFNPEWNIGTLEEVEEEEICNHSSQGANFPQIPKELNPVQRKELTQLLNKYSRLFGGQEGITTARREKGRKRKEKNAYFTQTQKITLEIHTRGPPIRQPFRRQNPTVRQQEQEQLREMLKDGIVRPSKIPWASPVIMVKKKKMEL